MKIAIHSLSNEPATDLEIDEGRIANIIDATNPADCLLEIYLVSKYTKIEANPAKVGEINTQTFLISIGIKRYFKR